MDEANDVSRSGTPAPETARSVSGLFGRPVGGTSEVWELRERVGRLEGELFQARHALAAERDNRDSTERRLARLSALFHERVDEEFRGRDSADIAERVAEAKTAMERAYREKEWPLRRDYEGKDAELRRREEALAKGVAELAQERERLKIKENGRLHEHNKRLGDLERVKAGFSREAAWLSERLEQRRALWEDRIALREAEIARLTASLSEAAKTLEAKEAQFRGLLVEAEDKQRAELRRREEEWSAEAAKSQAELKERVAGLEKALKEEQAAPRAPGAKPGAPGAKPGAPPIDLVIGQSTISPQDLVFGIAHQIRNPLAIIKTHAEFCLKKFNPKKEEAVPLEAIIRSVTGLRKRLDDLVDLTQPRQLRIKPENLGEVVEQSTILLEERCKMQKIETSAEIASDMPLAPIDAEQIKEALLLILLNSLEVMPEGGKLTVRAAFVPEEKKFRVEVSDSGKGIAKEHLKEVFKPFFSMKPGGIGLGLTLAAQICGLHGGLIEIAKSDPKGTTMRIVLPLEREAPKHG